MQPPKRHPNLQFINGVITYEELFGALRGGDEERRTVLGRLPRRFTLQVLSSLSILTSRLLLDRRTQRKLIELLDDGNANSTLALVRAVVDSGGGSGETRVFLHPQQVVATVLLVAIHGSDSTNESFLLDDFIRTLLMVNSLLAGTEIKHFEPNDPVAIHRLMVTELRSLVDGGADMLKEPWRFYKFLMCEPTSRCPSLPKAPAGELPAVVGMTLSEYSTAMVTVAAHAFQLLSPIPSSLPRMTLARGQWFSTLEARSAVDGYLELNSITVDGVIHTIGDGSLEEQAQRWRKAFLGTPLLKTYRDEYAYTFLPSLAETLGRALFSRMLTHYNEAYGKKVGDMFLIYYGYFLQDYVVKLLRRSIRQRVVDDELPYVDKHSSDNRIVDAVVVEKRAVVFIEVAAKRFNLTRSIIDGEMSSIDKDLAEMVVKKSEQLRDSIKLYEDGKLSMLDMPQGLSVYSLLVLQEFPQYAAIRQRAFRLMTEAKIELPNLQIITVDELELIEGALAKGYKLSDILKRKLRRPGRAEMSLTNYLITEKPALIRGKTEPAENEAQAWFQNILVQAAAWGLKGATPSG